MNRVETEEFMIKMFEDINTNNLEDKLEFYKSHKNIIDILTKNHALLFITNNKNERVYYFKESVNFSKYLLLKWLYDAYNDLNPIYFDWPSREDFGKHIDEIERSLYKNNYHKMLVTGDIIDYIKSNYKNCIVSEKYDYVNIIMNELEEYYFYRFCLSPSGLCLSLGMTDIVDLNKWPYHYKVTDHIILVVTDENDKNLNMSINSLQELDIILSNKGFK